MEKRKDNRGRTLKTGESQRKDGRYAFKYTDTSGNPQFVYSWKLTPTDRMPARKRPDISLREKEKEIRRDLEDGIDTMGKKMTVCQLYAKQNSHRQNIRPNTERNRRFLMNILENDPLGTMSIDRVKPSDAREWASRMHRNGYAYHTVSNMKRSLKASFYLAIEDDLLRKNPFNFALDTVIPDDTEPKKALTPEQTQCLVTFARNDRTYRKYADEITILLGTGLRISELCGLTVTDIDFEKKFINVDHQLLKDTSRGFYASTPKTKSGVRQIPMSREVMEALERSVANRPPSDFTADGYRDFLFLTRKGTPKTAGDYNSMLRNLVRKYNKIHDNRLPDITPHSLRHTFCTNLANSGMNPKALQYLMGHSSITMTLDYYSHADFDSAKAEMERLTA